MLAAVLVFLGRSVVRFFGPHHSSLDLLNQLDDSWHSLAKTVTQAHRYPPFEAGQYGQWLSRRFAEATAGDATIVSDHFDLMRGRDESACADWTPGLSRGSDEWADNLWDQCWRARIWRQIEEFDLPWGFQNEEGMTEHNEAALRRLQQCVAHPIQFATPQDDPAFAPLGRLRETPNDVLDTPCSLTATKVVLGNWWYFTCAILNLDSSGEAIWLKSQIQALRELGYTVLFTTTLHGAIAAHRQMPDVISHIWMEDKLALTCEGNPRCLNWSEFEPHDVAYPSVKADKDGRAIWPGGPPHDNGRTDRQKWLWTRKELDAIPVDERGTIPRHKLFFTTYWGSKPHTVWNVPQDGKFDFNILGTEWTLTPFPYYNHSYLPFSVEDTCMATTYVPSEQRADSLFILAKKTEYFWMYESIEASFWKRAKQLTGLSLTSTARDDPREPGAKGVELPEGLHSLGLVTPVQFNAEVAKSRLMLGIGRPEISPSVYHSLCMGTPVVLPYYEDGNPQPDGWDRYKGDVHQHGPAAVYGEPYVYSYRAHDENDLVAKIKQAKATPIQRFVPPEMSWSAVLTNMDDHMRFDWAAHGRANSRDLPARRSDQHIQIFGRCFEVGMCRPELLRDRPDSPN